MALYCLLLIHSLNVKSFSINSCFGKQDYNKPTFIKVSIEKGKIILIPLENQKGVLKAEKHLLKVINLENHINYLFAGYEQKYSSNTPNNIKLIMADEIVKKLVAHFELLIERKAKLGKNILSKKIIESSKVFNVREVKKLLTEKCIENNKTAAEAAYLLAGFQRIDVNYNQAYLNYKKAATIDENNPYYLNAAGLMAQELGKFGNSPKYFDESLILFDSALSLSMQLYGLNHPKVARIQTSLGFYWGDLLKYQKALEYHNSALDSWLNVPGNNNFNIALAYQNIGFAWYNLNNYHKSIEYSEKSLAILQKHFNNKHRELASIFENLGNAWSKLEKKDKAVKYYEKALSKKLKAYHEDHKSVVVTRSLLGMLWDDLGNYNKALKYYRPALKSEIRNYGKESPMVAEYRGYIKSAQDKLDSLSKINR